MDEKENIINGHEYVDLGLSVLWATCNVGAEKPEEYGDYYAWGETETKDWYDKYNCETCGMVAIDISRKDRDAAYVNWGGEWRMPTMIDCYNLWRKCSWKWTMINGVNGYKITGKNGNSIFLPAAGFMSESTRQGANQHGFYWTSSANVDDGFDVALDIYFNDREHYWSSDSRFCGQSIRPVAGHLM